MHTALFTLTWWMLGGLACTLLSADRDIRFAARVIVLFGWPWFLWYEATPTMARFIKWAERK